MEKNILGKRIKQLRESLNISQLDLSKYLNISNTTLSQYENGKRIPSDEIKSKLADYFNVSLDYLLGRTEEPNPINIPQEYKDKYKVTSRDKKQYIEHMKKANEAFFMNDEFDEEDKKEILDTMNEIFWKAKSMNKRKPKDE
ncbi:helix-turn-helix transcriptional regulator [Clostridium felsineum]|uniref:helix-turn-helix domain-containing protein n=1 Tax=Clostridium felsineum TaxID=36839 RepID=UPI00214D2E71|nr:helix-turn-helix transcriptional regulator [Clostridium felsineum]MCR3760294.1 helix-turn-helix transcriptional regulator [Clostridium felsineum]